MIHDQIGERKSAGQSQHQHTDQGCRDQVDALINQNDQQQNRCDNTEKTHETLLVKTLMP